MYSHQVPFIIKLFENFIVTTTATGGGIFTSVCVHFNTFLLHFHHYHYGVRCYFMLIFSVPVLSLPFHPVAVAKSAVKNSLTPNAPKMLRISFISKGREAHSRVFLDTNQRTVLSTGNILTARKKWEAAIKWQNVL